VASSLHGPLCSALPDSGAQRHLSCGLSLARSAGFECPTPYGLGSRRGGSFFSLHALKCTTTLMRGSIELASSVTSHNPRDPAQIKKAPCFKGSPHTDTFHVPFIWCTSGLLSTLFRAGGQEPSTLLPLRVVSAPPLSWRRPP
jgi:hypothetical protein